MNSEGGSEALQHSWNQPPAENQETDPTGEEHESKGALHPFKSPGKGLNNIPLRLLPLESSITKLTLFLIFVSVCFTSKHDFFFP